MIPGLSNCNNSYWTCHRNSVMSLIFNPGIKIKSPDPWVLMCPGS